MKKLLLSLLLSLALLLLVGALLSSAAPSALSTTATTATLRTMNSGHHFLPPYPNSRDRFGFDSLINDPLTNYDVARLNAGWYSDWGSSANPSHLDGLTYVQLLRFKAGSDPHDPAQVTVSPSRNTIANIAAANPGSLWMLSNEPDSLYQGTPIYPNVYAHVYHDTYHYIKSVDPTALVANGGIVQPTPCRMMYLDIVWDTYQQAYSETMPVDVWNIHAFILREVYGSWGASTPPGVPSSCGIAYDIRDGDDMNIFRDNLIAFRQWMKDKGEQNKPLIISEYGILWPEWLTDEDGAKYTQPRVSHFMTRTFDLFLNETFPDVGYPEDDYRLVQTWAWYSLSEDQNYNGYLFHSNSRNITQMGQAFANYTAALPDTPYADLTIHHSAALDTSPLQNIALADPYENTSVTLPIWVYVTNLGNFTATNVPLAADTPYAVTNTLTLPPRYKTNVAQFSAPIAMTHPGVYNFDPDFYIAIDPDNVTNDPRPWNNVTTVTMPAVIDARPDLVILTATWDVRPTQTLSGLLSITMTVSNEGIWPAPPVSGTLILSNAVGSLLIPDWRFSIPALEFGDHAIVTVELILPRPPRALYHLALEADSDNVLDEPDEDNNRIEIQVDNQPDLVISVTDWHVQPSETPSSTLNVTFTVSNVGLWGSDPVSGTRYLSNTSGTLLLSAYRFPIPAIAPWYQVTITQETTLPLLSGEDFYRLVLDVDSDDILSEQDEGNNQSETMIPRVVTTTLEPEAAGVLASASGHITLGFITGTVAATTELCFLPLWPPDLPSGPPRHVEAFRLTVCQGESVSPTLLLPVTITWLYTDTDVTGMNKEKLGLYQWTESDRWQSVFCSTEQSWIDENRLSTCIQQFGEYVFGYAYELYTPLIPLNSKGSGTIVYPKVGLEEPKTERVNQSDPPGSPLRLPPRAIPTAAP
ncbi:MAG: hypothetical protein GY832_27275 [Chloroflexi bacterium]|nr:hypothetical protein [Chloroflexota bacterium]